MPYDPIMGEDPKNLKEFWKTAELSFGMAEWVLLEHRIETREDAITGALRKRFGDETFRGGAGDFIRYREVGKEYDSRDFFITLGREFLEKVRPQLEKQKLTPKFAQNWGVLMMCLGFVGSFVLDDSDDLSNERAGFRSAALRSVDPQRRWFARALVQVKVMHRGPKGRELSRKEAESEVLKLVEKNKRSPPPGFPADWFDKMLSGGSLSQTYDQRHLPMHKIEELAARPGDDLPPVDIFPRKR